MLHDHVKVSVRQINPQVIGINQKGFTLIELMVSIVLGLLVTAAVMQVYYVSTKTAIIQSSGDKIIDANIFGLQKIEKNLKLANLGLAEAATGKMYQSGIIVTQENLTGITLSGVEVPVTLLTRGAGDATGSTPHWTGSTNTSNTSDQLTIQYRAPQNTFDCEGERVLGPRLVKINGIDELIDGQVVIERYFLAQNNNHLSLMCDAGRYITENMDDFSEQSASTDPNIAKFTEQNVINGLGEAGAVTIANVDDFQVLLGVMTPNGIQYITSSDYIDPNKQVDISGTATPDMVAIISMPIVSIKVGMLARGDISLPGSEVGKTTFTILGETTTLKSGVSENLIRKEYESNVTLRNARQL